MGTILQGMMGMLSRKKVVIPKTDDYITLARYASAQERMKPHPKVQTELVTLGAIKTFVADKVSYLPLTGGTISGTLNISGAAHIGGISTAGSQLTSIANITTTGTNVNTWIDNLINPSSIATGAFYGAVMRAVSSGSNELGKLVGANTVARHSGSGGVDEMVGLVSLAEQTGSGDINEIYGAVARGRDAGNGSGTIGYLRGLWSEATLNNLNATASNIQATINQIKLLAGTATTATVSTLSFDYTGGSVSGDFNFLKIIDGNYTGISGTARAINSQAQLPSFFKGSVEAESFNITALNAAPVSASATGTVGEIKFTENDIYVCVATNTWKKVAIVTF